MVFDAHTHLIDIEIILLLVRSAGRKDADDGLSAPLLSIQSGPG